MKQDFVMEDLIYIEKKLDRALESIRLEKSRVAGWGSGEEASIGYQSKIDDSMMCVRNVSAVVDRLVN